MRPDEEFASSCVAHFLPTEVEVIEGENPPDCYFQIGVARYAVEITQLRPVTFDSGGNAKNRSTEDSFSSTFCDLLDRDFGEQVPDNLNMCLFISGPIREPRKFKKGLRKLVKITIEARRCVEGWSQEFDISGNTVEVIILRRTSPTGGKIIGIIQNEDAAMWIQGEANVILADQVLKKEKIMGRIKWAGPRWLILLNNHPLASFTEYAAVYDKMKLKHGFERVFIVADDKRVFELGVNNRGSV